MNSESAQSSSKRLLDNDDLSQPEKQFKPETRNSLKDTNYLPNYEEETINLACSEKSCEIKESKNRNTYTDFVAKFEVPYEQFEKEKTTFTEKLVSKNNETYHFSLSNILYEGTVSSSLIFLFQNKPGLTDQQFEDEVSAYKNNFIIKNIEEENINKNKDPKIDNLEQNKIDNLNEIENSNESEKDNGKIVADLRENKNLKHENIPDESKEKKIDIIDDNNRNNNKDIDYEFDNHEKEYKSNLINELNQKENMGRMMEIDEKINDNREDDLKQKLEKKTEKVYSPLQGSYYQSKEELKDISSKNINSKSDNNDISYPLNPISSTIHDDSQKLNQISENNQKETYDIQINLYLINFKIIQKLFQKVQEGEILEMRMDIPSKFYNEFKGEGVTIVSEVIIRKNYDSIVKYNGIINEAMTCYMNSLIQTLYHIGYFTKAVFQIPLDSEDKNGESVVFSLQRLFFDLMHEKSPASTNKLISSFGWSREEIFIQHDVQEFNLMLNDLMENKMKGTKSEGTFKYLFEGTSENYIECIDVPYRSIKVEKFYDLQLTVKNCKNIYESLEKFTEVEILEGDNMYEAEGHGKQKAQKGVRFLDFPKVLMFQLKRFEYNPIKDSMEKINEMFEFTDQLNLNDYVTHKGSNNKVGDFEKEANLQKINYEYSLYSVVVHKGTIDRGHYYAFIRPENGNQWYQFNDEIVRKADMYEVFSNNFGGNFKIFKHKERGIINEITQKSDGNAYLLVYIRNDLLGEILQKVTIDDIPQSLVESLNKDKEYERRQLMLRIRSKKNIDIHLFSKEMLVDHNYLGIMPSILELQDVADLLSNNSFWTKISVPKDMKLIELRQYISKTINIPEKFILLYTYVIRDQKNMFKNILKRHEFKMHLIEESAMREQKISTINSYNESKPVFRSHIFIFIDFALKNPKNLLQDKNFSMNNYNESEKTILENLDLKIFERNEIFDIEKDKSFEDILEKEHIVDESLQKMIYYKFDNFWKFKVIEDIPEKIFDILKYQEEEYDNFKLFILKDIVKISNDTRIRINNVFSLPVEKNSDKYLTENIIKYSPTDKSNFCQIGEKIKKDEIRDLSIGIYLETTIFEPETSPLLKKQILLKRKRELKHYQSLDSKPDSNEDMEKNKIDVMDIDNNEKSNIKDENIYKEVFNQDNMKLKGNSFDINLNSSKQNQNFDSDRKQTNSSIINKLQIRDPYEIKEEEKLNQNQRFSLNSNNYNSNVKKVTSNEEVANNTNENIKDFDGEIRKSEENKHNDSKTYSVREQDNISQASIRSNRDNERLNMNPADITNQDSSNQKLSVSSREDSFKDNVSSNSAKNKNSQLGDTNSMINNHNSSNEDIEDRPKLHREHILKSKSADLIDPTPNLNGKVKTYRKILGLKRHTNSDKEITYHNLSSLKKNNNTDDEDQEKKFKNGKSSNTYDKKTTNSHSNDDGEQEDDQSLSPEDEEIMQQEISELDEFLFRIELLNKEKMNKMFYFSEKHSDIQNSSNPINLLNESSTIIEKAFEKKIKDIEFDQAGETNKFINSNSTKIDKDRIFKSSIFHYSFDKSNTDAMIIYLFTERESEILVINQFVNKSNLARYFEDQLNSVYVPIEFIFANKVRDFYGPKGNMKFKLRLDDDTEEILNNLIDFFNYNLIHYNIEQIFLMDEITPSVLFYNERRELISLEIFLSNIHKENFYIRRNINLEQIPPNSSSYNFLVNIIRKYPLLQLIDSKDALYKLSLQMFPIKLRNLRNFLIKDLTLYDIDNNPIIKIYFAFPNELQECNEYLRYINDDVLKTFYSDIYNEKDDEGNDLRNPIENSSRSINQLNDRKNSDEMVIDNNPNSNPNNYFKSEIEDLKKNNLNSSNENNNKKLISLNGSKNDDSIVLNADENNENLVTNNLTAVNTISIKLENFKFMLQHQKRLFAYDIFISNEEELFKYEKHNLNICYRIQPLRNEDLNLLKEYDKIFVAFCRRDSSAFCDPIIISLPNETTIGEMKKVIFNKLKKIKATQSIEYSKIKYYIYSLIDYKPHKDNLLINSKDEEKISIFFKKGPRNVLVELLQMEGETSGKELNMMDSILYREEDDEEENSKIQNFANEQGFNYDNDNIVYDEVDIPQNPKITN